MPAIEIRDLVKVYPEPVRLTGYKGLKRSGGGTRALDGVSLELARGEALGLVGTNGAGKTTLLKVICNLLLPDDGRVLVDGLDVVKEGREARRRLGLVVSDERSFYWRLTARRNLEFFASLHDMSAAATEARLVELSSWLGMEEFMDRTFSDLSSGMRQRVSLARGLLHDPDILLLDEPIHSLSPDAALEVDHLLAGSLRGERDKTLLLATQSMSEVERVCGAMCLLHRGRLLFHGTADDFRREALGRGGRPEMDPDELFSAYMGVESDA
jgi:ABC-type multidrug transport system ATPase subunit